MKRIILAIAFFIMLSGSPFPGEAAAAELPTSAPEVTGLDTVVRTMMDAEPEMDPALTFDWKLLLEQNDMNNVLRWYPGVRIHSRTFDMDNNTWLFLHGEDPVMLTDAYGSVSGQYKGSFFSLQESTDGVVRPCINGFVDDAGTMENLNGFFLGYLGVPERMELDVIEGELIWADAYYPGGYREKIAFDRGTLVMREVKSISDSGEVVNVTVVDYTARPTKYTFLNSWDRPLRNVELLWETFSDRKQQLRRETIQIPADWEYIPAECLWGEFTLYNNDQYIGPYQYPGDGEDYFLFLTTVKG